jgi:hypothetical protein
MTAGSTITLLGGTLILGAMLLGCQGGSDSAVTTSPSRDPLLEQSLASIQEHLGFMPVAPSVIPDGFSLLPTANTGSISGHPAASLIYAPLTSFGVATAPVLRAFAVSEYQTQDSVTCPAAVQSPGSRYECHELTINGQPASAETTEAAPDQVTYKLNLRIAAVFVTLDLRWQFPRDPPAAFPTDLQDIALRTAESLR